MTKPQSTVSVIVPVFNAANALRRCLNSITGQTWDFLDIVIVNDGSTDESLSIAEDYVRRDCGCRVFSQENRGVSAARNLGITKCIGDLMTFVDADDFIEPTMIEELVALATGCGSPLAFCDNDELWPHGRYENRLFDTVHHDTSVSREVVIRDIIRGRPAGLVCGKLFKTEIVKEHGIRFDEETSMCEDQLFFVEVAGYCNNFPVVHKTLYHYDRRLGKGLTLKWRPNAIEMHLRSHNKLHGLLTKSNLDIILAGEMVVRLKDLAGDSLRNEVSSASPDGLHGKLRRIKAILAYPQVLAAFDVVPVVRIIDKIERFLVIRQMAAALFVLCRLRAVRLRLQRVISQKAAG
jgi:glycosyltransferase involved in cell wall biosynthesis